ncbi:hypothetical protein QE368_000644 [Asaia bogorensis NBRC 16594]|nr:hypothetical protein [Asaia bogorensis]MDR6181802.1 hypothetical protein [Asaia bogorensis NBRC 16594]
MAEIRHSWRVLQTSPGAFYNLHTLHRFLSQLFLVDGAGVALDFRQGFITRDGGYLVWRTACFSKSPGRRFLQAMTRKIARNSCRIRTRPELIAETVCRCLKSDLILQVCAAR